MHQEGLPKPAHGLSPWRGLFLLVILLLILLLAWGKVALKHQTRHLETQYANALVHQHALKAEWGKLMLEKSHLTARARVQTIATEQLHLKLEKGIDQHNYQTIYLPQPLQSNTQSKERRP